LGNFQKVFNFRKVKKQKKKFNENFKINQGGIMRKLLLVSVSLFVVVLSSEIANAQWESCSEGLTTSTVGNLTVSGNYLFAGIWQGMYLSTDFGETWTKKLDLTYPNYIIAVASNGKNIFIGTWGRGVYVSTDYGEHWSEKNEGINTAIVNTINIFGNNIYIGTRNSGVFRSSDNGERWENIGLQGNIVLTMTKCGDKIFAGTDDGVFLYSESEDSWIEKSSGLTETKIYELIASGDSILAGGYGGFYHSIDKGENWVEKNEGMPRACINGITKYYDNIFAETEESGIYLSTDRGNNWIAQNNGITIDMGIRSSAICGNYIYVGTYTAGLFRAKLSDFGITVNVDENIPNKEFSIYPNPVLNILCVRLGQINATSTQLRIFDVHGRIVAENQIPKGINVRKIDLEGLPSGMYIINAVNGQSTETQKFVVIR